MSTLEFPLKDHIRVISKILCVLCKFPYSSASARRAVPSLRVVEAHVLLTAYVSRDVCLPYML